MIVRITLSYYTFPDCVTLTTQVLLCVISSRGIRDNLQLTTKYKLAKHLPENGGDP